jgi:hypothetical protein
MVLTADGVREEGGGNRPGEIDGVQTRDREGGLMHGWGEAVLDRIPQQEGQSCSAVD